MEQAEAPFDNRRLDDLLQHAEIDLLLATSKPNVQYLLGGHKSFFFETADAIGQSRYLPIFIYPRRNLDQVAYIGSGMEASQQEVAPLWAPEVQMASSGSQDAMRRAVAWLRRIGLAPRRIGAELGFLPADAWRVLHDAFPNAEVIDALPVLERLRAVKTSAEVEKLRIASDRVIDAMLAVMTGHGSGCTKRELVEALRREEIARGLTFDYCLITAGSNLNRAPSDQRWEQGDILSLDSGGNYQGYIGDVCRMAILGKPDSELIDLLSEVDGIQQAAMRSVQAGTIGSAIYTAAEGALAVAPHKANLSFVAHGMGLVSHEAPHLTDKGPVPYPAEDANRPLEANMVLSIETTLKHPKRGFIKLEDTVLVSPDGFQILGEAGRGWNCGGTRA